MSWIENSAVSASCRCKPKLKLRIINQNSVSVLQTPTDPETPTDPDQNPGNSELQQNQGSTTAECVHFI